jgi:hypothetical protein
VPWSTQNDNVWVSGGTGNWAGINSGTALGNWFVNYSAIKTTANTFTLHHCNNPSSGCTSLSPIDTTAYGSFTGQNIGFLIACQFGGCGADTAYLDYGATAEALRTWALLFRVTPTSTYSTALLALVDWMNDTASKGMIAWISLDSGRDNAMTRDFSIAFDWLYASYSSAQKTASATTINLWLNWEKNCTCGWGTGAYSLHDPTSNYWSGHLTAFAAAGYATLGDNGSAQGYIDFATTLWTTEHVKMHNAPLAGTNPTSDPTGWYYKGTNVLGYNYGARDIARLIRYAIMVSTATGSALANAQTYAQAWANAQIYELKPDRFRSIPWGRWTGNTTAATARRSAPQRRERPTRRSRWSISWRPPVGVR